ncbi:MAG: hypothetical protein JNM21_13715 [Taibaiella sp.]|nr:hypothetical protein [Taibaiella sp.]
MKKLILSFGLILTTLAVKAQSFLAPNNTREFTPYQSSVDVKLYEQVIRENQERYDRNLDRINELVQELNEYLLELRDLNEANYNTNTKYINDWMKTTFGRRPDLSDANTYNQIANGIKSYIYQVKKNIKDYR